MLTDVGSFSLGEINIGLMAALGFLSPLSLQLDLFISGQFGLGPLLADLQAQFSASVAAITNIQLQLFDPFAAVRALLMSVINLQASIQLAIALGLPTVSLQLSAQLSAILALAASLQVKIGGIKLLMQAGINIKTPMLKFILDLKAVLSAGPVHLVTATGSTLTVTGSQISSAFGVGLGPTDPINPGDQVSVVMMVMKDPAVFAALGAIMKVA
jgi:hypothetical protein